VSLEGLLAELLVATVLNSIQFHAVRVSVDVMVLGEQVGNGVEGGADQQSHGDHNLGVGHLRLAEVGNVLSDVVGHLGGGGGSSVVVLDHTVVELGRHSDNHVIEVGVEVATLGDIVTERSIVMVTSEQVVGVVRETGLMGSSLGELWGPHTLVGLLSLMHSHVRRPDSVVDLTLAEVPLLEVITAVLLMSGVNLGEEDHLLAELRLGETFINEEIVLLMHGTVAALAGTGEDLESTTETKKETVSKLWLRLKESPKPLQL
jgi:hypothetical protein